MRRGEIRWYTFRAPDKKRPVLLLARDEVVEQLNEVVAVPVTRTIRGLSTEVALDASDGMPVTCALNFDHVGIAQRARLGAVICELKENRWSERRERIRLARELMCEAANDPRATPTTALWADVGDEEYATFQDTLSDLRRRPRRGHEDGAR